MDKTEAGKVGNCGEPVLECCENKQQKCLISVTHTTAVITEIKENCNTLQLSYSSKQKKQPEGQAFIKAQTSQTVLYNTAVDFCQLWLQNQLSRRGKGNYIKLQVNSLASETFLLAPLFTGIEGKEPISDSSSLIRGDKLCRTDQGNPGTISLCPYISLLALEQSWGSRSCHGHGHLMQVILTWHFYTSLSITSQQEEPNGAFPKAPLWCHPVTAWPHRYPCAAVT